MAPDSLGWQRGGRKAHYSYVAAKLSRFDKLSWAGRRPSYRKVRQCFSRSLLADNERALLQIFSDTPQRNYVKIYNHSIPQRALGHKTPIQALKDWREKSPELFRKRVYNQAGLDK